MKTENRIFQLDVFAAPSTSDWASGGSVVSLATADAVMDSVPGSEKSLGENGNLSILTWEIPKDRGGGGLLFMDRKREIKASTTSS